MKIIFLSILTLLLSVASFGQHNYVGISVSRGIIYTTGSDQVECQGITILPDTVEYYEKNSLLRHVLALNRVNAIKKYNGNWSNTGSWIGGITGLGIGLAVAIGTVETHTDGYVQKTTMQVWPIYVIGLSGILIGHFIGEGTEDWKTVYNKNNAFRQSIVINKNYFAGVTVSCNVCIPIH
jgi:hypothetical protein